MPKELGGMRVNRFALYECLSFIEIVVEIKNPNYTTIWKQIVCANMTRTPLKVKCQLCGTESMLTASWDKLVVHYWLEMVKIQIFGLIDGWMNVYECVLMSKYHHLTSFNYALIPILLSLTCVLLIVFNELCSLVQHYPLNLENDQLC
jgi:hypothetical protein